MKYFIHIDDITEVNRSFAGDKAFNVALLKQSGARVPASTTLKTSAYKDYLRSSGIDTFILHELKRKKLNDYRWEELWDISLRIKNAFIRHEMPADMQNEISSYIKDFFDGKPIAVRSSAPGEDGRNSSFAGLHESYINLTDIQEILKHIRLVWVSLWSVSALLYRQELELDIFKSAMAVLVQELISGECSGVAFSTSPDNPECVAVESVYGLNQGLVDGSVEPDHWNIDRKTMRICDFFPASEHNKIVKPSKDQITVEDISHDKKTTPPLKQKQVLMLAGEAMRQEKYFGHPRDLEWTFQDGKLFLLQSRPITSHDDSKDSKKYYDNLLLSFDQLKKIRIKLENEILPGMLKTGDEWQQKNVKNIDESDLLNCLIERGKKYRYWLKAYDEYCIPFAHGVRLFGEIYNSRLNSDDPYEFVDLLRTGKLLSLQRNQKIIVLAKSLSKQHNDTASLEALAEIFGYKYKTMSQVPGKLLNLLKNYADVVKPEYNKNKMEGVFIDSFSDEQKYSAKELLDLARASYRLRDDDNIYLDGVKKGLEQVMDEASRRLSANCFNKKQKIAVEKELANGIPELHSPDINNKDNQIHDKAIKFRQLTGQPAGKGIAQGYARIINKFDDLFGFQKNEVLVCDAVEPEMTIVAPLASAVIERRGGMLIHGAIIAREYGLPCVTGVPKATKKIKNGDLLSVDGWLGIITIL